MTAFLVRGRARFAFALAAVAAGLLIGGCGGGSAYTVTPSDLANSYLPTTRRVEAHPDSVRAVSVEEKEERLQIALESSYKALHRKWSSTYQSLGTGRTPSGRSRSYATLWSWELTLAFLTAEMGVSSLSLDRARDLVAKQEQQYRDLIQVDVYWFEREGNTLLTGPGSRVELRVDGTSYQPAQKESGPLRDAFLVEENSQALYRQNSFYFPRTVDGTDILAGAETMALLVDRTGGGQRVRFSWSWADE